MKASIEAARVETQNRVLRRVIEAMASSLDLDAVLRATIDLVTEATNGDACFLHLFDRERGRLVLRAASEGFRGAVGNVVLDVGEGVTGWVAEHREMVVIPEDKWADPRYKYIPELRGELYTSMLSVPVVSRSGDLVGVFNVHSRERRDYGDRQGEFLRVVASLVAVAIEHADLFSALAEKEAALEDLVRATIEAQEEERRRVATEIHDGVSQQLVSVWYRLHAARLHLDADPGRARAELTKAQELVGDALDEARTAIFDLRPTILDDLGLGPGIRALALRTFGDAVRLELDVDDAIVLPPHHEAALYRIAQEAMTNALKHASPSTVRVMLAQVEGRIVLVVADDGRGFERASSRSGGPQTSFGLAGMTERAALLGGELLVESRPGEGTTVLARIPLADPSGLAREAR